MTSFVLQPFHSLTDDRNLSRCLTGSSLLFQDVWGNALTCAWS